MSWCLSKGKSWLFWFLVLMIMPVFLVRCIQGVCIEEERKALLEIKASLNDSYTYNVDTLLPTWIDHDSTRGRSDGECCDWERVMCNTTTGHITNLSLGNIISIAYEDYDRIWPLNISLFLHFKELQSLDLSSNYIDNTIVRTGFERLSGLKKLETLKLRSNSIGNGIFPLLSALTSLKILDLAGNELEGYFPAHEIASLENLEELDLTFSGYYGTFQLQGFERGSILKKLKILNLGYNSFNESLITSLSALPSLKVLNLRANPLYGSFPSQELARLTNLERLDLTSTGLNGTPNIQDCKILLRLDRIESIALGGNSFNKSIIPCLSFLPSLKILDISRSDKLGSSFPMQELSTLRELETLDLSDCGLQSLKHNELPNFPDLEVLVLRDNHFNGTLPMEALASLQHLEVLDLSGNYFVGSIPSTIQTLSSLRALSFANNGLNGSLPDDGAKRELDWYLGEQCESLDNKFDLLGWWKKNQAKFPIIATIARDVLAIPASTVASESSFSTGGRILDAFRSSLTPYTVEALICCQNWLRSKNVPIDIEESFEALENYEAGFCELKNLEELDLSQNMFDGNLPECFNRLLSLKLFDISSNRFTGKLTPSLIANLTSLEYVDFSHNTFEGLVSFSSFSNHKNLEVVEFISDNDKLEVETEEPKGWIPLFQLKVLVLTNCNVNRPKGSIVPSFLLHQHKLRVLDLSHNSLKEQFPIWLISKNAMLEVLNLRNNSFGGIICTPFYRNANTWWLDMSGNHMIGAIPGDMQKFLPYITYLNLSRNYLDGVIPSSVGDLSELFVLDLSHNEFSGEVPTGLFNLSQLSILKLSNNSLHGEVLSGNFSLGNIDSLYLESNCFTGKIRNYETRTNYDGLRILDISNNLFTGMIPGWISNISSLNELVVRDNKFEGQFPCGTTPFLFLDISENSFSGPIPSCLNLQYMRHLHLGSNRFTGSIPNVFRNLTNVLTLDIRNNSLSGSIPEFLGELSDLRILLLGKNNFSGSIPKQLCQLSNMSLIDLSSNSLSGSIPSCLQSIPSYFAYKPEFRSSYPRNSFYEYGSVLEKEFSIHDDDLMFETQDEVLFTTKTLSLSYKGDALDLMSGLDLSCNKLTGEIPVALGLLTQIHALNLSHNQLTGPIPVNFSNLTNIESLDLSSNSLSGIIPSQLIELKSLAVFNVSYNNLSGRLPEMKAQFSTFTKESYEGNPLLCGPPLEKKCMTTSQVINPSIEEGTNGKWYDIDMTSFYGSAGSTWLVFMLGFAAIMYTNPHWRRRWLDMVEEWLYTCYYFLYDLVRKPSMLFRK